MKKQAITIDVVSDVACPWCYVGKKRLENAIRSNNAEVTLRFHPFQLDPTIPQEGMDRKLYFENKFGSEARVDSIMSRVESAGEGVGVQFKFREIPVMPNTLPLHMLLAKALEEGFQLELANTLFDAYMVNPINLTDRKNLNAIMNKFGWSEEKTNEVLNDESLRYSVVQQIQSFQQMGIGGVPFFIINNRYSVSGAQPEDVWDEVFSSLDKTIAEGETCDPEHPENC